MSEKLFQVSAMTDLLVSTQDLTQIIQESNLEHKVEQEYLS